MYTQILANFNLCSIIQCYESNVRKFCEAVPCTFINRRCSSGLMTFNIYVAIVLRLSRRANVQVFEVSKVLLRDGLVTESCASGCRGWHRRCCKLTVHVTTVLGLSRPVHTHTMYCRFQRGFLVEAWNCGIFDGEIFRNISVFLIFRDITLFPDDTNG